MSGVAATEDHDVRGRVAVAAAGASGPANSGSASASSSHHERSAGAGCIGAASRRPAPRSGLRYRASPSLHTRPSGGHLDELDRDATAQLGQVTDGPERAPARAMLRAVGFSEEDFGKPQVGVASSWNEVTPCNYHLDKLAALAKEGVRQGDAVPIEFTTIAVSDGIAMGHEGMKASLISRDVIADSVELVMHAERMDALVGIAGCDKSEPGMLMAMARLNLPAVYLYGGTILAGHLSGPRHHDPGRVRGRGRAREGLDRRRRAPRHRARRLPDHRLVRRHVHGEHDGGGRPRRSACRCPAAASARRPWTTGARCSRASRASRLTKLLASGLRPRDILTKDAFANAIAVVMALAGSTNAVLHLLAIAHEAGVELELDDFDRISRDGAAPRRRPPGGEVRDAGSRPRRRRAGRDEGAARRRPAARRRAHGDRQDDRARTSRSSRRRRPTARSSGRSRSRSTPRAARRSSTARSRPRARS